MKVIRPVSLIAVMILIMVGPATAEGNQSGQDSLSAGGLEQSPGKDPRKTKDIDEKGERENACSCCRDCKAATHSIRGKEEGPPATDGCKDCCDRCGTVDMPVPGQVSPEILDRK